MLYRNNLSKWIGISALAHCIGNARFSQLPNFLKRQVCYECLGEGKMFHGESFVKPLLIQSSVYEKRSRVSETDCLVKNELRRIRYYDLKY
jgi:hypothetical protein